MFTISRRPMLLASALVLGMGGLAATAPPALAAPLVVQDLTGPLNPVDLAHALGGAGVSVSNVTYAGADVSSGTFSGGLDVVGFDEGVVLTSGAAATGVIDLNDVSDATTPGDDVTGAAGDADLTALAGQTTFDASVLEFDFVPDTEAVTFQYVFASEEYPAFFGAFNDVFALFVNGVNCAVVGSPPQPVSTGTISNLVNSSLFVDNVSGALATQMTGLSVVLTCVAPVRRNATNHMKLAIADARDPGGDSAVFLRTGPPANTRPERPYVMVANDGGVFAPGGEGFLGTAAVRPGDGILRDERGRIIGASGAPLDSPVVAFSYTPTRKGCWLVQANGGVIPIGDAPDIGDLLGVPLRSPLVGAAATDDGGGLYLVAGDGGVFALGSAPFKGSLGGTPLQKPIVGMALDSDGSGYLLVATDGGVFAYGALFRGSLGSTPLNKPIVGMAVDADGGYILAASDGGVFTYDAAFAGSLGSVQLVAPVVGIAADPDGVGYWMAGADGGAFAFGAQFFGSVAPILLNSPMTGIAAL